MLILYGDTPRSTTTMRQLQTPRIVATLVGALALFASTATRSSAQTSAVSPAHAQADSAIFAQTRADSVRHPYTASVQRLADRIINAQQDEIASMQQWLRERRLPVPDANTMGMKMVMNGVEHVMLMPGMLTDEQMKQLDAARGPEFDRLFLTYMMQHHRGAVAMVKELFDTYGAGQDETVFKFASDVNVDQTTEIARMQKMLVALTLDITTP